MLPTKKQLFSARTLDVMAELIRTKESIEIIASGELTGKSDDDESIMGKFLHGVLLVLAPNEVINDVTEELGAMAGSDIERFGRELQDKYDDTRQLFDIQKLRDQVKKLEAESYGLDEGIREVTRDITSNHNTASLIQKQINEIQTDINKKTIAKQEAIAKIEQLIVSIRGLDEKITHNRRVIAAAEACGKYSSAQLESAKRQLEADESMLKTLNGQLHDLQQVVYAKLPHILAKSKRTLEDVCEGHAKLQKTIKGQESLRDDMKNNKASKLLLINKLHSDIKRIQQALNGLKISRPTVEEFFKGYHSSSCPAAIK